MDDAGMNDLMNRIASSIFEDAQRYRWLVENAVIQFDAPHGPVRSDGKDPATTKQPLDNAIDAAMEKATASSQQP